MVDHFLKCGPGAVPKCFAIFDAELWGGVSRGAAWNKLQGISRTAGFFAGGNAAGAQQFDDGGAWTFFVVVV
jgi:hypothetical protein